MALDRPDGNPAGGFYSHDRLERLLTFGGRYGEGTHSATRIHPELQDLKVGDPAPYGAGVLARVAAIEPGKHLDAGETFVLRRLPGNRTRLIVRSQDTGYLSAAADAVAPGAPLPGRLLHLALVRIPGAELTARAVDTFIGDPLHHWAANLPAWGQRRHGLFVLGYYILLEGYLGQTLGKMATGTKVVTEATGATPGIAAAAVRTVLRLIDGLFCYAVAFFTALASVERQRLSDMAAHTLVIRV